MAFLNLKFTTLSTMTTITSIVNKERSVAIKNIFSHFEVTLIILCYNEIVLPDFMHIKTELKVSTPMNYATAIRTNCTSGP